MNKLILIGNGFDLAHGLKTCYKNFLLWHLNNVLFNLQSSQKHSDEILEIVVQHPIRLDDGKPFKTLERLFHAASIANLRFKYKSIFIEAIYQAYASGNWVNIESTYYRSLIHAIEGITHDPLRKTNSLFNTVKSINDSLHFLSLKLIEYLKNEVMNKAEKNPGISQVFNEITGANNPANKAIVNHPQNTLILNFNYTKTINLYNVELGLETSRTKMINIHGEIDSEINPIIFGYGDEMDPYYPTLENLNMNSILDHIKSFHYLKTKNYKELISFVNSGNPFCVYIMGHSCGISDRVLLNSIFEHKDCQKIKIYYYKREDGTTDFFEKTQEISRHFKPENKRVMRNKIVSYDQCIPLIQ